MNLLTMLAAAVAVPCASAASEIDHVQCLDAGYETEVLALEQAWQAALFAARKADHDQTEQSAGRQPNAFDDYPMMYEADLRAAQAAWIGYRDAECDSESNSAMGGTDNRLIWPTCAAELTRSRIDQLKNYVLGLTEGH